MADITEKIGAQEILLDPTKQYIKCGEVVNALTADDLMIQYNNEWIKLTKFIALLHMGIKNLRVKASADAVIIKWDGSNEVLIYIDGKEGIHPSHTNQHIEVVGKGKHHILVKEVGAKYGLETDIVVEGTTLAKPIQIKVSDVTTTSFTLEALNYNANEYYYSINSKSKILAPNKAITVSNLNPNTTYHISFYDLNGESIGYYSVQTDTAGYEIRPPVIASNQVFTFKENDEIGKKLYKLDINTKGLPLLKAHFDKDNKLIDYIDITADGWLFLKKKPSIDTLPQEWTPIDNDHKSEDARVVIETSAGGGANYVKAIIERVDANAPEIPYNQTFDIQENRNDAVGAVIGKMTIIDNGSPITKVEVSGAPDKYIYIGKNGDIISTGVPMDFELLMNDPDWADITPTGANSARKEAELTVTAYNANGSVTRTFRVRCVNMPDTAPSIDISAPLEVTINENVAPNTYLTKLPVSDDNSAITGSAITGGIESFLKVDNAGNVLTNAPADFELLKTDPKWKLVDEATVTLVGEVSFTNANGTSTAPLRLTVKDVADSKPLVQDLAITVLENTPAKSNVGKISVISTSAPIQSVTIDAPLKDWVSITKDGVITLTKSPDYENMPTPFTLVDGKYIAQSDVYFTNMYGTSKAVLLFQVANMSDSPSIIPLHQAFSVKEGVAKGSYVGTLNYILGDHTLTGFQLDAPASQYFSIDNFGNILLKAIPDFENLPVEWAKDPTLQKASVNSKVTLITDNGNAKVEELVAFTIENIADDKPFIQPDQTFGVTENSPAGTVMGTLVFNDMGNAITSATFTAPATKYFDIDKSGVIKSTQTLDWEKLDPADFTLDGQDKYLMSSVTMINAIGSTQIPIRLQVSNILDDKPTITDNNITISQYENFPTNQVLKHILISDNGTPLDKVEITDPELNGLISIDTQGDVRFKVSPNYEALSDEWTETLGTPNVKTKSSTIRAYNKFGYDEKTITVTIKDIVEVEAPTLDFTNAMFTNPKYDKATPIALENSTGNIYLIPVNENNSALVGATIDNPDTQGYLDIIPNIVDGYNRRNIGFKLLKAPNFDVTQSIPDGWTLNPTKAVIERDVQVTVTNGAGSNSYTVKVAIAADPITDAELQGLKAANMITGLENMRKVTSTEQLFENINNDNAIPDTSRWDMRSVTTLRRMYYNANIKKPIKNWVLDSATDMTELFAHSTYNSPIDTWAIQQTKPIILQDMFRLSSFTSPIPSLGGIKVFSSYGMFAQTSFNQPLPNMDFSTCVMFNEMFFYATQYSQNIRDIVVPTAPPWNKENINFHTGSKLTQSQVHPALW